MHILDFSGTPSSEAGAKEVHIRICSPIIKHPCHLGIDIQTYSQLIGAYKESSAHVAVSRKRFDEGHSALLRIAARRDVAGIGYARDYVGFNSDGDILTGVKRACPKFKGSYALVVMTTDKLIAVRDPHGIRPLCIGTIFPHLPVKTTGCAFKS